MPTGWCSRPATRRPRKAPAAKPCPGSAGRSSMPARGPCWCRTGRWRRSPPSSSPPTSSAARRWMRSWRAPRRCVRLCFTSSIARPPRATTASRRTPTRTRCSGRRSRWSATATRRAPMARNRRQFLVNTSALAAGAALPLGARGQGAPVRIGVLHPVTGFLAYSGALSRLGAQMAIDDINAGGGIKALGGAKLQAVLGDAQSKPEVGAAEVEKMNEQGVSAIVGAYASAICLATTQAAAKYRIPHIVDVGVADQIVQRGLTNVFRFAPGYKVVADASVNYLHLLNSLARKPAKSVLIVHEESLFGTGTANLLAQQLPGLGYDVKEVIKHANPTRDFSNIVLRVKAANPDIVIP